MKKFLLTFGIMILALLAIPVVTGAQVQIKPEYLPGYVATLPKTAEGSDAGNVILQLIAGSLIYVTGPVAVLMIAIGGFRYVISHGETTQMEAAKKTILWAIIGLLVIIVSYSIVRNVIDIAASTTPPA